MKDYFGLSSCDFRRKGIMLLKLQLKFLMKTRLQGNKPEIERILACSGGSKSWRRLPVQQGSLKNGIPLLERIQLLRFGHEIVHFDAVRTG